MDEKYRKELAFRITNELENHKVLVTTCSILAIENVVKETIDDFIENVDAPKPNRFGSKQTHWPGPHGTWCNSRAKNPMVTNQPDLVTCRRCLPQAMAVKAKRQKASASLELD